MSNGEARQEQMSSVTLSRNAKGQVQPEVKVYDVDPDLAEAKAIRIFEHLCGTYPHHDK